MQWIKYSDNIFHVYIDKSWVNYKYINCKEKKNIWNTITKNIWDKNIIKIDYIRFIIKAVNQN